MTTLADAREFLVELISQLFHADVLITEQAERIDGLESEVARLRIVFGAIDGGAGPTFCRSRTRGAPSPAPLREPFDVG